MTPGDVVNQILPYIKAEVLASETSFKQGITNWLKQKNFVLGLAAPLIVNILWNFITGFGLSFAITMAVNVCIALAAPYLLPFIPVIDEVVNIVDNQLLAKENKTTFQQYCCLFKGNQPTIPPPEPVTDQWENYL